MWEKVDDLFFFIGNFEILVGKLSFTSNPPKKNYIAPALFGDVAIDWCYVHINDEYYYSYFYCDEIEFIIFFLPFRERFCVFLIFNWIVEVKKRNDTGQIIYRFSQDYTFVLFFIYCVFQSVRVRIPRSLDTWYGCIRPCLWIKTLKTNFGVFFFQNYFPSNVIFRNYNPPPPPRTSQVDLRVWWLRIVYLKEWIEKLEKFPLGRLNYLS